jgi:succinate-acetate transporter protein
MHTSTPEAPIRINLRPLASPLPLGLFSFGVGMVLLAAQSAEWIRVSETKQVGLLLAAFVFPLEGVAAIIAFLARDVLAATVLGLFATSWLSIGLQLMTGTPGVTSHALGFYLLAFGAVVVSLAAAAVTGKPLIALVLTFSAARAIIDGIFEFSNTSGLEHVAGYVAAALAALAWYAGTAFLLEDLRREPVLPVFRVGTSADAVDGELRDQLGRAEAAAGVRKQL